MGQSFCSAELRKISQRPLNPHLMEEYEFAWLRRGKKQAKQRKLGRAGTV